MRDGGAGRPPGRYSSWLYSAPKGLDAACVSTLACAYMSPQTPSCRIGRTLPFAVLLFRCARMAFLTAMGRLPEPVRALITAMGGAWPEKFLHGAVNGEDGAEARVFLRRIWHMAVRRSGRDDELPSEAEVDDALPALRAAWYAARPTAHTLAASLPVPPEPIMEAMATAAAQTEARLLSLKRPAASEGIFNVRPPTAAPGAGSAALVRWPTRGHRAGRAGGNPKEREDAEAAERARWLVRLAEAVIRAKMPAADLAEGDPEKLSKRVGQGRRSNTLRRRVRDWEKFEKFLVLSRGLPWPRSANGVLDYVEALEDSCERH